MNDVQFIELMFLWREYACEQDERLTEGARKLKQDVLDFVVSLPKLPVDLANEHPCLCGCGKKQSLKTKEMKK